VKGPRKIICKHPLEWNKELYNDDFRAKLSYRFGLHGERYELLKEECEQLDMWNDKGTEKGLKSIAYYAYGFHGGVDFSGADQKVVSLIHGEVWACTYQGSVKKTLSSGLKCFGICMVIKDINADILYLLAHLEDYLVSPDVNIEPEQEIAKVGNSGFSDGAHLHVEAYDCTVSNSKEILDNNQMNKPWKEADAGYSNGLQFDKIKNGFMRKNPFNHGEKV
jgi:murein DD-endopeptidase MepM/ murein hydrolase activator NlpD